MINQVLYNNKLQRRGFYLNQGPCECNYIYFIVYYLIIYIFYIIFLIENNWSKILSWDSTKYKEKTQSLHQKQSSRKEEVTFLRADHPPPLPSPHTHSHTQTKSHQNICNTNFEHAVWQINCCCNLCYHTWFSYIILESTLSSCTLPRHLQASVLALSYLAQGPQHTLFLNKNAADTESLERII